MKHCYEFVLIQTSWGESVWVCLRSWKECKLRMILNDFDAPLYEIPEASIVTEICEFIQLWLYRHGEDRLNCFTGFGRLLDKPSGYVLKLKYLGGHLASMSGRLPKRRAKFPIPEAFEEARQGRKAYRRDGRPAGGGK